MNYNEVVIRTGDFVYKYEEGYIYFVDRKDDMIKTKGCRVSPKEIEEEIVLIYSCKNKIPKNEMIFEFKKHLPNYMIPTIIEHKVALPLKASHHESIANSSLII